MRCYAKREHNFQPVNTEKHRSYHWWFHPSPYAVHVRPRPKFPAWQDVSVVSKCYLLGRDRERLKTDLLHPVKLCVGFAGAADGPHSEMQKGVMMLISADVSSKPQHHCWFLWKSSDLDTSDDFSAELDRSHGFLTASGEGQRSHHASNQLITFSRLPENNRLCVFCTCGVLLSSATRVILHDREIHHRTNPKHSHTLQLLWQLTSSGFSDAFRLRRTNRLFEIVFTREGTRENKISFICGP